MTSESSSASTGKQTGSLDRLPPSVTQAEEATLPAEESGTSATELDLPQLHRFVSFYFKHWCHRISVGTQQVSHFILTLNPCAHNQCGS